MTESDPGALLDPDDEAERHDTASSLDYLDDGDPAEDPTVSLYDTSWSPPDREPKGIRYGTTLAEERAGEPLDIRLAEEEPDILASVGDPLGGRSGSAPDELNVDLDPAEYPDLPIVLSEMRGDGEIPPEFLETEPRAGRLVEADEGLSEDREPDLVARDVGRSGGAASAEEAAVHVVDEP